MTTNLNIPCAIEDLMSLRGTSKSNDPQLRATLEYFLPYLKNHPDTLLFDIEYVVADRYAADFVGLCVYLHIPEDLHWITARMNGLRSPTDYSPDQLTIISPNPDVYALLVSTYNSNNRLQSKKKKS